MKLSKRTAMLVATGIAGAMALTACGGGSDSGSGDNSSGAPKGRVVFGEATDFPENLYPNIAAGNATSVANLLIRVMPGAYTVDPEFNVEYDKTLLTADPTLDDSNGTQTNVYKINPKAVWSDGTPISAKDFEFTWRANRSGDPADGGCASNLTTTGYENIDKVVGSDDDKTVTVTYKTPYADWKSLFGNILPQHLMDNADPVALCDTITKGWPIADGLPSDISGGPFQIKKSNIDVGGQIVVLTPNEKYWGDKPKIAQLVDQNIGNDPTTAVQGLQSGELGVIYPQPQLDLVNQIEDLKPNVDSDVNFGLSFEHLDFNTTDPQLSDIKVRQAFAMALDRQDIVDQTVGQFSSDAQVLNNRVFLNNQPQYKDTAPSQYKKQDVAGAKALLEGDGYTLGADGIYTKGGKPLSFKIDTTANNPLREQTINVMIPQLKQAGIAASFNANPDIFASKDKPTSLEAGGFQIALFAWVGTPFVSSSASIYKTPVGDNVQQNYSRTGTPAMDALWDQLSAEPDTDKQADLGNEIDKQLWDQMATIPLYQKPTFIAYQSSIKNVKDNPSTAGPLWNAEKWSTAQ